MNRKSDYFNPNKQNRSVGIQQQVSSGAVININSHVLKMLQP